MAKRPFLVMFVVFASWIVPSSQGVVESAEGQNLAI